MKAIRRRGTALSTLLVGCALIAPGVASAESSGALAPELEQLATPAVQTQPIPAQAEAIGFPAEGPGSLEREGEAVTVEVRFEEGALAALPALEEAGAEVVVSSDLYQLVTVRIDPAYLAALAEVPGVISVEPVRQPIYSGVEEPQTSVDLKASCEGGKVLTEGLDQLEVVSQPDKVGAREAFGVRGAGVTVGVLSNSFDVGTTINKYNVEKKQYEEIPIPTHAAEDIRTEDLPGPEGECSGQQTPVRVLQDGSPGPPNNDEGRAMLQIVHDIAPHAELAFATAAGGELNMAKNIERLAAPVSAGGAGATVIVDDVTYPEEPMFQDGPIAAAINKVTAGGVTYVTAAGNTNFAGPESEEIGSWEIASFNDSKNPGFCPIPVGVASRHCLDFEPGTKENNRFEFTIEQGKPIQIALGWSEPEFGLKSDLDLFLLREVPAKKAVEPGETEVVAEDKSDNILNGRPAAYVHWINPEPEPFEIKKKITEKSTQQEIEEAEEERANSPKYKDDRMFVVINRCVGTVCDQSADPNVKPRTKMIFLAPLFPNPIRRTQYETSSPSSGIVVGPTIFGHAGDPSVVTVGASELTTEGGTKINEAGTPDIYSARGPVTHYWAPVNGTTPAAKLGAAEVIEKPNVVATDCVANTFFTNFTFFLGFWRFCGTSAAAPHAAGVVALEHQIDPFRTPLKYRTALSESAKPVTGFGSNVVGKGLIRARLAVEAMGIIGPVNDPPSTYVAPIKPTPPPPEEEEKPAPAPEPTPTPAPSPAPSPPVSNATGGEAKSSSNEKESGKTVRTAPTTTIKTHPPKLVKSPVGRPKLKFTFVSDQKGATFECSVDGSKWKTCPASYKAPFTLGEHELKVRARMSDGLVDKTPAVWKFKVKLVA